MRKIWNNIKYGWERFCYYYQKAAVYVESYHDNWWFVTGILMGCYLNTVMYATYEQYWVFDETMWPEHFLFLDSLKGLCNLQSFARYIVMENCWYNQARALWDPFVLEGEAFFDDDWDMQA